MKCPVCGSEVRPSKKYPGKYLCDTCKKRFPESALIADEPETNEEKEQPKKKKKWPIALLVLLLLILLAVGAVVAAYFVFPEKADPIFEKFGIDIFQEDASKPDEKLASSVYSVSETADYNGISVSVLGYEESDGDEWSAPADGNKFVFVNMKITNNTDEEIIVNSMASFENYCGDTKLDYSANAFTALATSTDKPKMDGNIAPGETLNGYLSLEVPSDWTALEIQYAANVWTENKIRFKITK